MVGWGVLALGAGILVSAAATQFIGGEAGGYIGLFALWVAMVVPVAIAFRRSVPRGLLRFRAVDLLFGIVLGVALRIVQGWLASTTGPQPFPSLVTVNGQPAGLWLFDDLLAPGLIAPVIEEFFFHGLVLVAIFVSVRRIAKDQLVAGFAALLLSTGLFVLAHAVVAPISWYNTVALVLVALVNGLLVLLTGRIWPAIVAHMVYNLSFFALALVGTFVR